MKILIINTLYYPDVAGGAEKSIHLLAEEFSKNGHTVVIITTSKKEKTCIINGVKVYYLHALNIYWFNVSKKHHKLFRFFWHLIDSCNYFAFKKIDNIVLKEKPDLMYTSNLLGVSVIAWKVARKNVLPIVHSIRDYYLLCWRSSKFKDNTNCAGQCFGCKILSFVKKKESRHVKYVVGVSKHVLEAHKHGYFPVAQKLCIYDPIEKPFIDGNKRCKNKGVIFGFVGFLSKAKGIEFILEQFRSNFIEHDLYVYGVAKDQAYNEYLKSSFACHNIMFRGFQEPRDLYREFDVLLVPSIWNEPFGRIVIEAYSYGIPVIASKRGGISEIVENLKTGILYDPDCASSFVEAVEKIIDDPILLTEMSKYSKKYVEKFYIDNIAKDYLDYFSSIIEDSKL